MARKTILAVLIILAAVQARASSDTFSVFFRTNESRLPDAMRDRLDRAIYDGVISDRDAIWLIGYADEVGGAKENLRLSKARAASVRSYLVSTGFKAERITLMEGKGKFGAREVLFNGEGYPRDRRVDIVKAPAPAEPVAAPEPVKPEPPKEVAKPIDLGKVAVGESVKLDNIYFQPGSHAFQPSSEPALQALYDQLVAHPDIRIMIEGHICCIPENAGDGIDFETGKAELSLNRAYAVRNWLVAKGIATERLKCHGFGRSKPVYVVEHDEAEMQANRRVEIRIVQ